MPTMHVIGLPGGGVQTQQQAGGGIVNGGEEPPSGPGPGYFPPVNGDYPGWPPPVEEEKFPIAMIASIVLGAVALVLLLKK